MSYRELAGLCDGFTSLHSVISYLDSSGRKKRRSTKPVEGNVNKTIVGRDGHAVEKLPGSNSTAKKSKIPRPGKSSQSTKDYKAAPSCSPTRCIQHDCLGPKLGSADALRDRSMPDNGRDERPELECIVVNTSNINLGSFPKSVSDELSGVSTDGQYSVYDQQIQLPSPPSSTTTLASAWTPSSQQSLSKMPLAAESLGSTESSNANMADQIDICSSSSSRRTSLSPVAILISSALVDIEKSDIISSTRKRKESTTCSYRSVAGLSSLEVDEPTPKRIRTKTSSMQRSTLLVKLPIQCRLGGLSPSTYELTQATSGRVRAVSIGSRSSDDIRPDHPKRMRTRTSAARKPKPALLSWNTVTEDLSCPVTEQEIRRGLSENLDPAVISMSFRMHARACKSRSTPKEQKPCPVGQPTVWAADRQAMCETLPYFNSHNGGCAMKDGTIFGFMFDKGANDRDFTSTNVIIARAGGGMETVDGVSKLRGNQGVSNQVLAFQHAIDHYIPIPIILGGNNPTVESRLSHSYNVTDLWKPTDIWHEKDAKTGHTMIRYRFEVFDIEKLAWWGAEGVDNDLTLGSCGPVHKQRCPLCGQESKQVYINGWMCLQSPHCQRYWMFEDGSMPIQDHLRYDARFLLQKTPWPFTKPNITLTPPLVASAKVLGINYSKYASKGVVCRKCGRCNQRLDFMKWLCEDCGWQYKLPQQVIPIDSLVPSTMAFTESYDPCRDVIHPAIKRLKPIFLHGYRISVYLIPGIEGFIAHAIPNRSVVELPGGPNECFECLQTTDIGLKRRAMPQKGGGEHRMASFTRNYGQYYKFVADTEDSAPIQDAPMAVRLSAKRMDWLANLVKDQVSQQLNASIAHQKFNEVLALAYLEGKSIGFHDDGEKYVGPTIATESFGSNGNMIVRMKEKYQKGYSGRDLLTDDTVGGGLFKPIPLCNFYRRRLEVYETELVKLYGDVLKNRKAELVKEIKNLERVKKGKKATGTHGDDDEGAHDAEAAEEVRHFKSAKGPIDMKLRHGDITIMHGVDIQRYYEHAVLHEDSLRFALTCRSMEPNPTLGDPPYKIVEDDVVWEGWRVPT